MANSTLPDEPVAQIPNLNHWLSIHKQNHLLQHCSAANYQHLKAGTKTHLHIERISHNYMTMKN